MRPGQRLGPKLNSNRVQSPLNAQRRPLQTHLGIVCHRLSHRDPHSKMPVPTQMSTKTNEQRFLRWMTIMAMRMKVALKPLRHVIIWPSWEFCISLFYKEKSYGLLSNQYHSKRTGPCLEVKSFFFLEVKSFTKDCFILFVLGSENGTWGEMCPFNDSSKRICDRLPKDVYLLRPWCWERLKAGGEGDNRGWDGWMASLTQRTWVWASSGRWWRTGRPGVLQFRQSQRFGQDWTSEEPPQNPGICQFS